jgi:membrane protein implicated in regulation of membrane protease activity
VVIAAIPVVTHAGKFGGIYLIALTLPWSGISIVIVNAIAPELFDHSSVGAVICSVGAVLNAYIIHRVSRRVSRGVTIPKPHTGDEWRQ